MDKKKTKDPADIMIDVLNENVEKMSALQCVKIIADKLKSEKLKNVASVRPYIDGLQKKIGLKSQLQTLAFVAVFDRQCGGRASDTDDISEYYACSRIESMELVPAMKEMTKMGIMEIETLHRYKLERLQFRIEDDVVMSLLENRPVKPTANKAEKFDQYDLCSIVSGMLNDNDVSTRSLLKRTEELENEHCNMEFLKQLKSKVELEERVLFYEMCNDYMDNDTTSIGATLSDMYDRVSDRSRQKCLLLTGNHPLMKTDLIEQTDEDEMTLAEDGKCLLMGNDAEQFGMKPHKLDRYDFVKKMSNIANSTSKKTSNHDELIRRKVAKLEQANKHLTFIKELSKYSEDKRLIFYCTADKMTEGDCFSLDDLDDIYGKREAYKVKKNLCNDNHPLVVDELVEHTTTGFFNNAALCLTDKGKELFLGEDFELYTDNPTSKELLHHDKIETKHLFFAPQLESQLQLVRDSLEDSRYNQLRTRLKEKNLPEGIAILLYGGPGTGKTESVMQLAKSTGRDVMHVDISQTKSCWFGESEKKIKKVFQTYRRLCKSSKVKPILLFNEADAVFSKRKDVSQGSVTQTENAIQNIILEEMERLDGILIATTNMADNLDAAFERRFLFKIQFDKPATEAKQKIWADKMPMLAEKDTRILAERFDFSGGEIDNIVRKATMKELIEGKEPSIDTLMQFCKEEKLSNKKISRIGFAIV